MDILKIYSKAYGKNCIICNKIITSIPLDEISWAEIKPSKSKKLGNSPKRIVYWHKSCYIEEQKLIKRLNSSAG